MLEIQQDIYDCLEKERELITAFREGRLEASDLSNDKKASVIDSLYQEFEDVTKNLVNYLQWGVVVLAGGLDPCTGRIRTVAYNYGCTTTDSKDFITSFNDAAEAGHVPGTPKGESKPFSQYYGLPFMYHMKKVHLGRTVKEETHIKSPADVDPATLVHDDAAAVLKASKEPDFFQFPDEATALVSQSQMTPAAQMSLNPRSWSSTSSPVFHSLSVMASLSISSSPITTAATLL
ncbi:hypothetical protein ARMSODRAFT_1023017 [Armillaria solidipes]|uniref:Uncharacterized protein n=1 Tax=Armillaria solidipes TaxID=1076256 RepID=A0A2H3B1L7_9AGAR|nr:hypothetical protein ARMSODRAFT_1023017 [Armillaria solidipes]